MRKVYSAIAAGVVAAAAANAASAAVTVEVRASRAPNLFGSPSFATYFSNLRTALESGATSAGDPSLPSYYTDSPAQLTGSQNVVTGFSSWDGVATPAAPFTTELGNRLSFPVRVLGNGEKVSLSGLTRVLDDSRGTGVGLDSGSAGFAAYDQYYIGIDYVDGIKGNGNDIVISSGSNTQLVDEIIGRGSGNAPGVQLTDAGLTPQDKIDTAVSAFYTSLPFDFTGTYTYTGGISDSASVTFVPEPASLGLLGLGGVALLGRRRRRNRTTA